MFYLHLCNSLSIDVFRVNDIRNTLLKITKVAQNCLMAELLVLFLKNIFNVGLLNDTGYILKKNGATAIHVIIKLTLTMTYSGIVVTLS